MKKVYPSQTPEARRKANVEYREKNREKLLQYDRARYEERYAARKEKGLTDDEREQVRLRVQQWRAANPDLAREVNRRWKVANPGYISPSSLDRDRVNAKWREAYHRNIAEYRAMARRKRAKRAGATGSHTEQEWHNLLTYFQHSCVYCGAKGTNLTRDHVIPLSRVELSPTDDIDNILPACGPCNSRKKDKTDGEYRRWIYNKGGLECLRSA